MASCVRSPFASSGGRSSRETGKGVIVFAGDAHEIAGTLATTR
jgi:hypothetical protein